MTLEVETLSIDVEDIMHLMPYGTYIVGSTEHGEANGMIADWVMQIAFEPRMLAVSFEDDARTLMRIHENSHFTVNFLRANEHGMELAKHFVQPYDGGKIGRRRSMREAEKRYLKLEGVPHELTDSGCPVLDDATAWLECQAEQFMQVGDHVLAIARVLGGELRDSADVLTSTFTGWVYSG